MQWCVGWCHGLSQGKRRWRRERRLVLSLHRFAADHGRYVGVYVRHRISRETRVIQWLNVVFVHMRRRCCAARRRNQRGGGPMPMVDNWHSSTFAARKTPCHSCFMARNQYTISLAIPSHRLEHPLPGAYRPPLTSIPPSCAPLFC